MRVLVRRGCDFIQLILKLKTEQHSFHSISRIIIIKPKVLSRVCMSLKMSEPLEDSKDPWKYVIALSKFILLIIDGGYVKSLGVLLPEMVSRYDSDYKTMAFVCGLPSLMYAASPIADSLMKVFKPRTLGMIGGLLTTVSLLCVPLTDSVIVLALILVLAGCGMTVTHFAEIKTLNEFFEETFAFMNTLTQFGWPFGAFILPVITERSLEAYGYQGAFLILGGITLHALVCAACVKTPIDRRQDTVLTGTRDLISQDREQLYTHEAGEDGETENLLRSPFTAEETAGPSFQTMHGSENTDSNTDKQQSSAVPPNSTSGCFHPMQWLKSLTVVKESLYAIILPAIFLEGYVMHAWMLFLVPHAMCFGIPRSRAVFLSTIAGISGVFGKTCLLILLHFRVNPSMIFVIFCLMCATSFFLDVISSSFTSLAVMAMIQGFTMFLVDSVPPVITKVTVRNENVSSSLAIFISVQAMGMIIGDVTSGHILDVSSSCSMIFISLGIILVAMSINTLIFMFMVRHYIGNSYRTVRSTPST